MDIVEALSILNIDSLAGLSLNTLKKQYHKLALQYHPDKKGQESTGHFQKIGEAYELIKREIDQDQATDQADQDPGYMNILNIFLKSLFKETNYTIVLSILTDIVSVKLFEKIDKETCIQIYDFIIKYKTILHISDETLNKVREIILEKYKDVQIFILNPSLIDLFENNVYKLKVDESETIYYVPLWHNEIVYDGIFGEIIVKCIPDLPENIEIDENNNLLVNIEIPFTYSLLHEKKITVLIDKYSFDIPVSKLSCSILQTIVLKGKGISRIVDTDIFNIYEKSDIIFRIKFIKSRID